MSTRYNNSNLNKDYKTINKMEDPNKYKSYYDKVRERTLKEL